MRRSEEYVTPEVISVLLSASASLLAGSDNGFGHDSDEDDYNDNNSTGGSLHF